MNDRDRRQRPANRPRAAGLLGWSLVLAVATGTLLAACADHERENPGTIVLTSEWIEPGPGVPISIGGYAIFGRLTGPGGPGPEFELTAEHRITVPAGAAYTLDIWLRTQNDAVEMIDVPGGTPRMNRLFGPIEAQCRADVAATAAAEIRLVVRATVGLCEVVEAG